MKKEQIILLDEDIQGFVWIIWQKGINLFGS